MKTNLVSALDPFDFGFGQTYVQVQMGRVVFRGHHSYDEKQTVSQHKRFCVQTAKIMLPFCFLTNIVMCFVVFILSYFHIPLLTVLYPPVILEY